MALTEKPFHIKLTGRSVPQTFPPVRSPSFTPQPPPPGPGITGGRPNDPGSITRGGRRNEDGGITRGQRPNDDGIITRGGRPNDDGSIRRDGSGGLRVGGLRVGVIRIGDLGGRRGLEIGSLRIGDLRIGSLRIGSLRIGSLRIGSLRIGSLRVGSLGGGGLHDGLDGGGTGKRGKAKVDRTPIYREIIFGIVPSGDRHLEVDWVVDKWGRRIRTVVVWTAKVNGIEWTPETWDQYIPLDGSINPGITYPGRGDLQDGPAADHVEWKFENAPHSTGTELGFDVPDETGRIRKRTIEKLPVTAGETEDHLFKAAEGQTIYPEYNEAWLSPST